MYDPVGILERSNVKAYFLSILDSELSSAEKYQQFLDFFSRWAEISTQLDSYSDKVANADKAALERAVSEVGQAIGFWKPKETLERTKDSIRRAIGRLRASQHPVEGGWGYHWEQCNVWGTVYAIRCLDAARSLSQLELDMDLDSMLSRGVDWLQDHRLEWTVEDLHPQGEKSVYELSLVYRCLAGLEVPLRSETSRALAEIEWRIATSQNEDGGWDANIWGVDRWPVREWSEVGATSSAIRALAQTYRRESYLGWPDPRAFDGHTRATARGQPWTSSAFLEILEKGLYWLAQTQNYEGSWNTGSCRPEAGPFELVGGVPVITKTCDGLKGLLVAVDLDLADPVMPHIEKAAQWLRRQERPLLDSDRRIGGWGWLRSQENFFEHENTAMTLETLLLLPEAPLEYLTANANWLIENQFQQDGHIEDGNWHQGDTPRITLTMINYYKRISASSLFEVSE